MNYIKLLYTISFKKIVKISQLVEDHKLVFHFTIHKYLWGGDFPLNFKKNYCIFFAKAQMFFQKLHKLRIYFAILFTHIYPNFTYTVHNLCFLKKNFYPCR